MPELSPLTWAVGITALVIGILAGHFGWGKRWPARFSKLHPDYLAGLHYLVTEQPDRALDMFLKLMDANADTLETHFALGSLYRRRGEVERAIRIHQSLLAREALAPEYREQALLALAQDYLRAGLLDRAERVFQQVAEVPRLRATALDSLRGVYERQHEWRLALDTHRELARIKAAPPRVVAAHYLCELATVAISLGDNLGARRLLREARRETARFPRAAVLRAQIASVEGQDALAVRLLRSAVGDAPHLIQEQLPALLRLAGPRAQDALLSELVEEAAARGVADLKRLVFAALCAGFADALPLRTAIESVFAKDAMLNDVWRASADRPEARVGDALRVAHEVRALLVHAERFRCNQCGFAGRSFYWHCPACHAWDSFEAHAIVNFS